MYTLNKERMPRISSSALLLEPLHSLPMSFNSLESQRRRVTGIRLATAAPFIPLIFAMLSFAILISFATVSPLHKRAGNDNVAGDLYGLGIRIGTYLQTLGMLLACVRSKKTSGAGIKLAASSIMLAELSSWTSLVRREMISPCEAWLVITLLSSLGLGASVAVANPYTIEGEGLGIALTAVALVWNNISALWFFVDLSRSLPTLGTNDLVFMFAPVNVTHWFRTFMIVNLSFNIVSSILLLYSWGKLTWLAAMIWLHIDTAEDLEMDEATEKTVGDFRKGLCAFALFVWIMTIAAAEKIIEYNDLSPENDLSKPGQTIPLVIGILIALDGVASMIRPPK